MVEDDVIINTGVSKPPGGATVTISALVED